MELTETVIREYLTRSGGLGALYDVTPSTAFTPDHFTAVRLTAERILAQIPLAEHFGNYANFVERCDLLANHTPHLSTDPKWVLYIASVQKVMRGGTISPQLLDRVVQQCWEGWRSEDGCCRIMIQVGIMTKDENRVLAGEPIDRVYGVEPDMLRRRFHIDDGHTPAERREYARHKLQTFLDRLAVQQRPSE